MQSMTGFGRGEANVAFLGTVSVEMRSTNHKFLETVLHVPDGFIALEDKVKKQIESQLKRGRISCIITVFSKSSARVCLNQDLLSRYIAVIKQISKKHSLKEQPAIDTLINLPGVLSLKESKVPTARVWPELKKVVSRALDDLVLMRRKEGAALLSYLSSLTEGLANQLKFVQGRFKKVIQDKSARIKTDVERAVFLKETDITEELDRLIFHIKNFKNKLLSSGPVGKELDFMAQEMQREANTIGAKSCDVQVSAKVVQIKSQIEKLREQVQNIE